MKKIFNITLLICFIIIIGGSFYFNWQTNRELNQQRTLIEQQKVEMEIQSALMLLSVKVPNATLGGFTQVEKIYVAQVSIPEGSSHLYVFIGGQWFDLGEGQLALPSNNQTEGK